MLPALSAPTRRSRSLLVLVLALVATCLSSLTFSPPATATTFTITGELADVTGYDRVSTGEVLAPDSGPDTRYYSSIDAPGAHTISYVEIRRGGSIWNTAPNDNLWIVGVTAAADGAPFLHTAKAPMAHSFTDRQELYLYTSRDSSFGVDSYDLEICLDGSTPRQSPPSSGCRVVLLDNTPDNDADGYSWRDGDCDDADASRSPGVGEIPGNTVDEDCDGAVDTTSVALVSTTFDTGAEGWTVSGDPAAGSLVHQPTGGNPDGFLRVTDGAAGSLMYWTAPASFLGDKSLAYGSALAFDLRQSDTTSPVDDPADVVLQGGGLSLRTSTPRDPGVSWTPYSVALEPALWKNVATGAVATEIELRKVLDDLTSLRIRAEYRAGADVDDIDNIRLYGAPPAPLPDGGVWSVGSGWRTGAAHSNAAGDTWRYYSVADSAHGPAAYTALPNWNGAVCSVPGFEEWTGQASVARNSTGSSFNATCGGPQQVWPAGAVSAHPMPGTSAAVAWVSPGTGTVSLEGAFIDRDAGGGNGIAWSVEKGSTLLALGSFGNGGSQQLAAGTVAPGVDLSQLTVAAGDVLYLRVSSHGDHSYDLTQVDVTVRNVVSTPLTGPLVADPGPDQQVVAGDTAYFDATGSTPAEGITSYEWTTSDGRTASGPTAAFAFPTASATPYTVTLTVGGGGQTATESASVLVTPVPVQPGLAVTVTDNASPASALSGAKVLVLRADGSQVTATSDAGGRATLHGLADGTHTVYVLASGYKPDEGQATVADGSGALTVALSPGQIATTSLQSAPMTAQEAVDAGIDTSAPENQNAVSFDVVLAFDEVQVPFTGFLSPAAGGGSPGFISGSSGGATTIGSGGSGSGGCSATSCSYTVGDYVVEATVEYAAPDAPTLLYMVIPGKAKWLKEFYDVRMMVSNLGSSSYSLSSGSAALDLPAAGLALPALGGVAQANPVALPAIAGGETATASWVVRGDAAGTYPLTATYSGVLQPFGVDVDLLAQTANPIRVWGTDAIDLSVVADSTAVAGSPYGVVVTLQNVTSGPDAATLYNVGMAFEEGLNFTYLPGQQRSFSTAELAPGGTLVARLTVLPHFSGTLQFADVVRGGGAGQTEAATAGAGQPARAVQALTAVVDGADVELDWDAVPGATEYLVYRLDSLSAAFGGTPEATVPASATATTLPTGTGQWFAVLSRVDGGLDAHHAVVQAASAAPAVTPLPGLSLGDLTVLEGDTTHVVEVPVALSRPAAAPVTMTVSTVDGTAKKGAGDYVALPTGTTVTIDAGQTSTTVPVTVNGDDVGELSEAFTVKATAKGVAVEDGAAVVRLVTDDAMVTASVDNASVVEGAAGQSPTVDVPVRLSAPSDQPVALRLTAAAGTATSPADFTAFTGSLVTVPAGVTSVDVPVTVIGDATAEPNETITTRLAVVPGQAGIALADGAGLVTIVTDDNTKPPAAVHPAVSVGDAWTVEADSGATQVEVPLTLNRAAPADVTVRVKTANATATAGSDYTALDVPVTIPAGDTSATVAVGVLGDQVGEADEKFSVVLVLPPGAPLVLGDATGGITIADDEGLPVLSIADVAHHEGDAGTTSTLLITVRRSQPAPVTRTGAFLSTANSTATAGVDYTAVKGVPVVFDAGSSVATVAVPVTGDAWFEGTEALNLSLKAATGHLLSDLGAVATLLDEEGVPQVSVGDVSVPEGTSGTTTGAAFPLTLSGLPEPGKTVSVRYATVKGTAAAGSDFVSVSGASVSFPAGQTSTTAPVVVKGDDAPEPDQAFTVKLSSPVRATVLDGVGTGTIVDDD